MVGRVILRNFEFVHLGGKSVEEDFESLKHCLSLRDKGKNFILRWKINSSSDFDVSLEAIEKMRKEFDLGEDFFKAISSVRLYLSLCLCYIYSNSWRCCMNHIACIVFACYFFVS